MSSTSILTPSTEEEKSDIVPQDKEEVIMDPPCQRCLILYQQIMKEKEEAKRNGTKLKPNPNIPKIPPPKRYFFTRRMKRRLKKDVWRELVEEVQVVFPDEDLLRLYHMVADDQSPTSIIDILKNEKEEEEAAEHMEEEREMAEREAKKKRRNENMEARRAEKVMAQQGSCKQEESRHRDSINSNATVIQQHKIGLDTAEKTAECYNGREKKEQKGAATKCVVVPATVQVEDDGPRSLVTTKKEATAPLSTLLSHKKKRAFVALLLEFPDVDAEKVFFSLTENSLETVRFLIKVCDPMVMMAHQPMDSNTMMMMRRTQQEEAQPSRFTGHVTET